MSSSVGLHPVKEVCGSRGFVPGIPVSDPFLFSSLPLPPSLMLCLSTDNLSIGAFPLRIPKATPELKDEQKRGRRDQAEGCSLQLSLLLHSLPNLTATVKGWEGSWKLRSSLKTKLAALFLLLQPVLVASVFPGKTAQWLAR